MGHVMGRHRALVVPQGFPPDEQPLEYADVQRLRNEILRRNAGESPEGRTLTSALVQAMERSMPGPFKALPRALTRHLIGGRFADMLDVPRASLMDGAVGTVR